MENEKDLEELHVRPLPLQTLRCGRYLCNSFIPSRSYALVPERSQACLVHAKIDNSRTPFLRSLHLRIRPPPRMRAPMTPMASMASTPPRPPVDDDLLLHRRGLPAHQGGQQTRDEEEDTIHNAKGPAGLEHRACLVHADPKGIDLHRGEDVEGQGVSLGGERGAVVGANAAEVVDAGDEGANETQVDECDEMAVVPAAVIGEEGKDGPHGREDRDDEKDENGGGGEQVLGIVDVDEVGEHAEGGDLLGGQVVSRCLGENRYVIGRDGQRGNTKERDKRAYESDYFHEAPEGEEDSEQHCCGCESATTLRMK